MSDWFLNLPIPWMALIIFAATYLIAACVYLVVVRLAVGDRARAFKAFSPGMLRRTLQHSVTEAAQVFFRVRWLGLASIFLPKQNLT
jgi:hypothetical protein